METLKESSVDLRMIKLTCMLAISKNADGTPVDVSRRVQWSRQLDKVKDAKLIADYSRTEFVSGWKPRLSHE